MMIFCLDFDWRSMRRTYPDSEILHRFVMANLPVIDLDLFLSQPLESQAVQHECKKVSRY